MKSDCIQSQGPSGIGRGCSSPPGFLFRTLFWAQVWQPSTYRLVNSITLSQPKCVPFLETQVLGRHLAHMLWAIEEDRCGALIH